MAEAEIITYRGNCHCGDIVFEIKAPEIKKADNCECSICVRQGYLWLMPGISNVNIVKGSLEQLTTYTFGEKKMKHLFCPKCATAVAGSWWKDEEADPQHSLKPSYVNANTIQGLNCWDLKKIPYDGASKGEPYQPPAHKGELPKAEEGELVYTGSCHCGAVTVATTSKPIDETHERVIECNCTVCSRIGSLWVYSPTTSVVLSGDEANIGKYEFNTGMLYKTFCKICGVGMTNSPNELTEDQIAALPEVMRGHYENQRLRTGVNARVLHGVDVSKLNTVKIDGLNKIPGNYVNP
ncbi:hypothetical protein M441DRAFT_132677 [Trichoderma asperellum CBS 433.97]|uniref:CENP-V/GFA domain-containing protein n=1 Tax=Trichoderma asperellum (strain ATCC 204424 / CBS 433.97 / NBRC 101777) TaxID=1042311 RepID=A0A2T3ZHW9_TRIA4|nr:hypothetical protein M441DRAFT_132677 [Trichoderma asperellum CBS 433.97]PTB44392.1 hypothetical protein M441DRAFT_132677 [Trichoderma asperellum CBS 433.97]